MTREQIGHGPEQDDLWSVGEQSATSPQETNVDHLSPTAVNIFHTRHAHHRNNSMSMRAKSRASAIAQHASPSGYALFGKLAKIKYRLHNSVRVVVRHVVAARDESVVNQTSEPLTVGLDALRHHHRILRRVQNDRRNGDLRLGRQLSLDLAIHRIARRQTIPMPIRVDHHIHEVRVIEGQRGPDRNPRLGTDGPEPIPATAAPSAHAGSEPNRRGPARHESSTDTRRGFPPVAAPARRSPQCPESRNRRQRPAHRSAQATAPQQYTLPCHPNRNRQQPHSKPEPIDHLDRIPTNRRLLTTPRYHIRQKPGRAEAAQIGRDNPPASSCESVRDGHIRPRVVRKAMQQQHRPPTRRTRSLRHNR